MPERERPTEAILLRFRRVMAQAWQVSVTLNCARAAVEHALSEPELGNPVSLENSIRAEMKAI
jgi:hypothetical protein